jgi:drug/metabolite transporter (DMT)-like permease
MVLCTILWSSAGIVTRFTTLQDGFEATFWRAAFCAVFVGAYLVWRDRGAVFDSITAIGWPGIVSSLMWAAMFTTFMLALMRTTVANVLVMSSLQPFFAAILARLVLGEHVRARTWITMAVAFAGVFIMFADILGGGAVSGALLALVVPVAAAVNIVTLKRSAHKIDFAAPVMIGGVLALYATLGAFQLALPCVFLSIWVVKRLSAAEVGLLALLEVILGPIWVWLAFNEQPTPLALMGGAIVLGALAVNELLGMRGQPRPEG